MYHEMYYPDRLYNVDNVASPSWGWSGCAMVLGKLPVPGRPTIWMIVGQGPIVLAVGAGGSCLDIFTLLSLFSPLYPSLWETTRCSVNNILFNILNKYKQYNITRL